jgi:hypothetical protein
MHHNKEARRGGRRERAPEYVLDKNNPEFTPNLLDHQARGLISRSQVSPVRARLLAELAFGSRRPA